VPLEKSHDPSAFSCGETALDEYLKRFAYANHASGSSRAFVSLDAEHRVAAYYCLSASQVSFDNATERVTTGLGHYDVPVVLISRLAVDRKWQKNGVGRCLLRDAVARTVEASKIIGIRALLVSAKSDSAKAFYQRYNFEPLPSIPMVLMVLLKDAKALLR
jgi:GNAT superfamily N-acetyltransferase